MKTPDPTNPEPLLADLPEVVSPDLLCQSASDGSLGLVGGRHRETGRLVFPLPPGEDWLAEMLPQAGSLWSFTVQRFRPKSPPYAGPDAFEPYAVGYVDLGPLIVEARLTGAAFEAYRIGMPMKLVPLVLELTGPARQVATYAFAPDGETR